MDCSRWSAGESAKGIALTVPLQPPVPLPLLLLVLLLVLLLLVAGAGAVTSNASHGKL